jgi:predicted transcriptional regulator
MEGEEQKLTAHVAEIRSKLTEIQDSLRRFQESPGPTEIQIYPSGRGDILEVMVSQVMDDVEEGLYRNMVRRCEMREPCRATFTGFLQKNASLLEHDTVREEVIITNQDELDRLRETAPYGKCSKCFNEVSRLFGKQIRLMRSMRIYSTSSDKRQEISELQEGDFVQQVLEPIASKHRLQILKTVSQGARTFSALSETTALKGGNLLFHVQRLIEAGMIVQRRGRGDYMITEKGFKVLKGMSDVHQLLKP